MGRLQRYDFDQAYIERLVAQDLETERHFTKYFGDLLLLKLRSRLPSSAHIEDARQETFARVLTVLREKGGLASAGSLGAFVNSVCNNVLFEAYRTNARATPLEETYDPPDDREPGAENRLMADEERERVRSALAELPERDKKLLTLLFLEGRDKEEVSRLMNVDRNYLRVLVHRAKATFRDKFLSDSRNLPAFVFA